MERALQDSDFIHFLRQLRRKMPLEAAEVQLIATGYQCNAQRPDYADDKEYVAAIMGIDSKWLDEHFG